MQLKDIIDDTATDKNTTHVYLPIYQGLFENKRESARRVLEIGLGHGGSAKLWNDFFVNADIHVLDINMSWGLRCKLDSPRIHLKFGNAYTQECVQSFEPESFDILIDDGPHLLESMVFFITNYSKLLKPGGIMVIEDIPELEWTQILKDNLPNDMSGGVLDIRHVKNRFDDILFIATKPEHV